MNDTQALNHLIAATERMLQAGCQFAKDDDPEAYAAAGHLLGAGTVPRIEITLGNKVTVRATAVDADGEDVVQLFSMTAYRNAQEGH